MSKKSTANPKVISPSRIVSIPSPNKIGIDKVKNHVPKMVNPPQPPPKESGKK